MKFWISEATYHCTFSARETHQIGRETQKMLSSRQLVFSRSGKSKSTLNIAQDTTTLNIPDITWSKPEIDDCVDDIVFECWCRCVTLHLFRGWLLSRMWRCGESKNVFVFTFAQRSHTALTIAAVAMWMAPFSGPSQRAWPSEASFRQKPAKSSVISSKVVPTTVGFNTFAAH